MAKISQRHAILVAILCLAALLPSSLLAQTFAATSDQKFQLELDTKDGNFSQWAIEGLAPANALRATISVARFGTHERFVPFLRVEVRNQATSADLYSGLLATGQKGSGPLKFQTLQRDGANDIQKADFSKTIGLKDKIALEISWATPGKLIVRLDSAAQELPLSSAPTSLRIMSGTGDFFVSDLVLGKLRP